MSLLEEICEQQWLRSNVSEYRKHAGKSISIANSDRRMLILQQLYQMGGICLDGIDCLEYDYDQPIDCWRYLFPSLSDAEIAEIQKTIPKDSTAVPLNQAHVLIYVDQLYYPTHIAQVINQGRNSQKVRSKFGFDFGVYEHKIDDVPNSYGNIAIPLMLPAHIRNILL